MRDVPINNRLQTLLCSSSSSFGRASTPGRTQTGWGREFILLVSQAAVLPGSDAGSDVVMPSKTVRPRAPCVVPDVWSTLLEHGLRFAQRCHTHNSVKERDPICAWTNGISQHQSAGG